MVPLTEYNLELKTPGIKSISFSSGKKYIGYTGRLINTQLQEHKKHKEYGNKRSVKHFYDMNNCIELNKYKEIHTQAFIQDI